MICVCGGRTLTASARDSGAILTWQRCGACTRCWEFTLEVGEQTTTIGEPARLAFLERETIAASKGATP